MKKNLVVPVTLAGIGALLVAWWASSSSKKAAAAASSANRVPGPVPSSPTSAAAAAAAAQAAPGHQYATSVLTADHTATSTPGSQSTHVAQQTQQAGTHYALQPAGAQAPQGFQQQQQLQPTFDPTTLYHQTDGGQPSGVDIGVSALANPPDPAVGLIDLDADDTADVQYVYLDYNTVFGFAKKWMLTNVVIGQNGYGYDVYGNVYKHVGVAGSAATVADVVTIAKAYDAPTFRPPQATELHVWAKRHGKLTTYRIIQL